MQTSLTAAQHEALKRMLHQRYAALLEEIRAVQSESGDYPYAELLGGVPDFGDESVADLLIDVNHALVGRDLQELRDIEQANGRINAGCYGSCEDCGAAIDYARLASYPTAKRCLRCQAVYENTHAHARTSTL